jgi:site-specific recombinase XerD
MPPSPRNNDELVAAWCEWMAYNKGRTQGTVAKYRGYLVRLASHYEGRLLLELEQQELEVFAGAVSVKAGLSGRSRRALVSAIRGFYKWAQRAGEIRHNPAGDLPYPQAPRTLPLPISLENAERLIWAPDLDTFKGLRDAALFAMLVGCGMRLSGLVGLNQEYLVASEQRGDLRFLVRLKEKGDHERLVPVPRDAQLLLTAYLGHPDLDKIDRQVQGGRVLFVSVYAPRIPPADYRGERRRLTPRGVRYLLGFYGRRLGVPKDQLHPHAMRHLYGAELAEGDVDLIFRQALMGHKDPKSTQIYSHVAQRKLFDISDRSNPLARMRTPVSDLLESLKGAKP